MTRGKSVALLIVLSLVAVVCGFSVKPAFSYAENQRRAACLNSMPQPATMRLNKTPQQLSDEYERSKREAFARARPNRVKTVLWSLTAWGLIATDGAGIAFVGWRVTRLMFSGQKAEPDDEANLVQR